MRLDGRAVGLRLRDVLRGRIAKTAPATEAIAATSIGPAWRLRHGVLL